MPRLVYQICHGRLHDARATKIGLKRARHVHTSNGLCHLHTHGWHCIGSSRQIHARTIGLQASTALAWYLFEVCVIVISLQVLSI
jgi:hypothetical protein